MPLTIPEPLRTILDDATFVHLATMLPSGHPHVSAMWVERDGDYILFNTAEGRRKLRNVEADPKVGISISPGDDAYRCITVWGRVVEITRNGADVQIDRLANKYLGTDYPWRSPGERRVTLIVQVDHISG